MIIYHYSIWKMRRVMVDRDWSKKEQQTLQHAHIVPVWFHPLPKQLCSISLCQRTTIHFPHWNPQLTQIRYQSLPQNWWPVWPQLSSVNSTLWWAIWIMIHNLTHQPDWYVIKMDSLFSVVLRSNYAVSGTEACQIEIIVTEQDSDIT